MNDNFHIGDLYQVSRHVSEVHQYPLLVWNIKENRWTLPSAAPYWNTIVYGTHCLFLSKTSSPRSGAFLVNDAIVAIPYEILL